MLVIVKIFSVLEAIFGEELSICNLRKCWDKFETKIQISDLEIAKIGTVIILGEIYRMYVNKGGLYPF